MAEFPAMPLFTDAYLADTSGLTTIEHGAYLLLLIVMWRNGGWLPRDDRLLAKYARLTNRQWARIGPILEHYWIVEGDRIVQKRLVAEMNYVRDNGRKQRQAAENKWPMSQLDQQRNRETRSQRLAAARKIGRHSPLEWETMRAVFGVCVRCGTDEYPTERDHIVPIYQGGSDGLENIQPVCARCNASKGPEAIDHRWQRRQTWLKEVSDRLGYNPLEGKDRTPAERLPNASPLPRSKIETNFPVQSTTQAQEERGSAEKQAEVAAPDTSGAATAYLLQTPRMKRRA